MTGPGHYREAEKLTQRALRDLPLRLPDHEAIKIRLAAAQVHATLALAAATAMAAYDGKEGMHVADFNAWDAVAGVEPTS